MPGKLILTITAGPMNGKMFVFDEHETFLFGRMADCHICLPEDKTVSRHHFLLEINPPQVRIRDPGSLHGTYVNSQKYGSRQKHETPEEGAKQQYPQVDLHDGDTIRVGKTTFQMHVEVAVLPERSARCQCCGKALSASVEQADPGDTLCEQCRQAPVQDPLALLPPLLLRASQTMKLMRSLEQEEWEWCTWPTTR